MNFVFDRLQIKEPIEAIEEYWKYRPIKTNWPTNKRYLIGKANINSALSNWKRLLGDDESTYKQITKNNCLAKSTTLAKAKISQKAIDQTITITANITDNIGWGPELARGPDQGLEVWNRSGTRSWPRKLDTQEVDVRR